MPATEAGPAVTRRQLLAALAALAARSATRIEPRMQAPPEVLSYFRERELAPRFSWLDVWAEEHAHAFTVAGVTEARVLAEFRAGIDKAIAGGTGFEAFQAEMRQRLTPLGWWGPRTVADPQGRDDGKRVDFSRPRRLEVTFWSNVRAARAAGQWDRIQRTKKALPFLLYVRTTSSDPRPEHLGWAGIILPVDDPWWTTHFPPNGWMCKCAVRQITAAQAERSLGRGTVPAPQGMDGTVAYRSTPPDDGPPRRFVNRRTGERSEIPAGIDPGWHTNPGVGRGRTLGRILAEQLDASPGPLAAARTEALVESDGFSSFLWRAQARGAERKRLFDAGTTVADVDQAAPWSHATWPVGRLPDAAAVKLRAPPTVTASDAAVGHTPDHHYPDWMWARVPEILAQQLWRRRSDARLFAVKEIDGRRFMLILSQGNGGRFEVVTMFSSRAGRAKDYITKTLADCDLL
jgi:hypothetical protein